MMNKDKLVDGGMDWVAFDAMTDEEVTAAAFADPDCPPSTPEQLVRMRRITPARHARMKLRMTLEGFADAYGIPVETLRAWERHQAEPTPAELAFLRAITVAPEAVRKALAPEPVE